MLIEHVAFEVRVDTARLEGIIDRKVRAALQAGEPVAEFRVVRRPWVGAAFACMGFIARAIARWGYTIR